MSAAILVVFSLISPAAVPPRPAAAAKVWTNSEIEALESTAPISIIGQAEPVQSAAPAATSTATPAQTQSVLAPAAPYVKEQDPNWYAQGIDSRREQIDQINSQIQDIEQIRATGEGISAAIPLDKAAPGITPEATIEILQDQKNHLESEIGDLQDLAQSNSINRDAWR